MRVFIIFTTLLVGLSGWVGYRWGHGPEPALAMWAEKPRQRPQGRRPPRESPREVIQRLKRDEKTRQDAIGTMIHTWARRAPEEVLEECDQLPISKELQNHCSMTS